MQKKLNTAQQETLFASECKLINLRYEYQGYTGTEIWAIVSELSEKELFEKYPDVISRYTPFVLLSIEQGKVIDESYRNTHKYEMRCKRTYDLYDYKDGIAECFHKELITPFVDSFEQENDEEEVYDDDESGNFDEKELGRSDDPVRMYLKEMGTVELLSREGEIAIAKRIEAGKTVMIDGLCESPMTIKAIADWRDDLLEGRMQLRDIVDLEMMYGDDAEAMVYDEEDASVDDLEKVAEEIATKDNLDDIDDDLEDDIELEDAVDDDVEEEDDEPADTADDEEGSASSGDDDDVDGVGGRASASVAAMEEALLEPVLEILTKISSYYDDLKKIQN